MAMAIRKTDSKLHEDVLHELAWDTRVTATEVGVEVRDGVVTLSGMVDTWGKRLAAQEAAHRVAGVLDVANDIEVRPRGAPGYSDPEIAQAVRGALRWDSRVPDELVQTAWVEPP